MNQGDIIVEGKLTKKRYMSLPDGCYIVSGVYDASGYPVLAEPIAGCGNRPRQWVRIKELRVDQRKFMLFDTKASFARWFEKGWNKPLNRVTPADK